MAAAAAAAVVVVRARKHDFGAHTFSAFYAQHALRHILRHVLRYVLRRVLHVLVLHVSPKGKRGR